MVFTAMWEVHAVSILMLKGEYHWYIGRTSGESADSGCGMIKGWSKISIYINAQSDIITGESQSIYLK